MYLQNELNVFCDMDGFIFKYSPEDYIGNDPAYAKSKYFENRPIDARAYIMVNLMKHTDGIDNLYILSRGSSHLPEEARGALIRDKMVSIKTQIPWFNLSNAIISDDKKVDAFISRFNRKPCKSDILIDDFNDNLKSWIEAGGSAIKYINDVNSQCSYAGPKIVDFKLIDVPSGEEMLYEPIRNAVEI